jgi:general secretion pathway protein H
MTTWANNRGFTLLEVMMVLALVAIVLAVMIPVTSASSRERKLRAAAGEIEGLVREQRDAAREEGRRRLIDIRPRGFFERGRDQREVMARPEAEDFYVRYPGGKWEKPAGQTWEFSPAGMVTPLSVRLEQGDAYIEVDFDLLTGRVAEERYAF